MTNLEITIQRMGGDGWPVVVEQSQPSGFLPVRTDGLLRLDQAALRAQLSPRDYGAVLGQALFQGEVRDAFVRARTTGEDMLRVLLCVEAPDLRTLHWERLCAPLDGRWQSLATNQRLPLSLYLPSVTDRRFPAIGRRDLRALVLAASPAGSDQYQYDGLLPFDVARTVAGVQAALGEIPSDVLANLEDAAGPPTLDALCERITAGRYTLLHLICHGRIMSSGKDKGETVLYLAAPEGGVAAVPAARLLDRLGRLRGPIGLPHFAFLATCESAGPEAEGALGGLAQRLVRDLGMPAVVAMSEPVTIATAQALATPFYVQLRAHGEVDLALVEACAGLAERHDITVPALYSRLGARPLFSDTLDRQLTNTEIHYGLDQLGPLFAQRAPVLLRPAPREPATVPPRTLQDMARTLRGLLDTDVLALSGEARKAREQALAGINALCDEVLDCSFNALALGQAPPAYDARCPFQGLAAFRITEQAFFFGRDALVEHLRRKLAADPLLPALGPSGCGKSSLVLAGLVPLLQREQANLQIVYLTPGRTPLHQLEASLAAVTEQRAVLVVDQFEEIFTLSTDDSARHAFLARLLQLPGRLRVILTMRADFWGECAAYPELRARMQAGQELIAPMDAVELRRAMELQATAVGLRFEADLSSRILDDVQGEPGAMPLLQHALLELWKRRHGRWLRAEEYRAIGGVRQAIAHTADGVYAALSATEQERARDIFIRLTRLDTEAVQGEERRDTRRRVQLDDLVPAGSDASVTKTLVSRLADARLVITSTDAATGRNEVEIVHEALIRYWPQLRRWLDEDRASLQLRQGVSQAAAEWEGGGKDENLLVHRGPRLVAAEALIGQPRYTLNTLEQEYVDACITLRQRQEAEQEQQRQRELQQAQALVKEQQRVAEEQARAATRLRWGAAILAIVLVGAIASAVYALHAQGIADQQRQDKIQAQGIADQQRQDANHQQKIAEQQLILALSRQLVSQSLNLADSRYDLSLLLSLEATRISNSVETQANVLHALDHNSHLITSLHGPATSVAFSPDGRILASGGDGTIMLWNVKSEKLIGKINTRSFPESIAFDPSGKILAATCEYCTTIQLWDTKTMQPLRTLANRKGEYLSDVVFSPDGRMVASTSEDLSRIQHGGYVGFWDVKTGRILNRIFYYGDTGYVAFSHDGKRFAVATGSPHTIQLWDISKKIPIRIRILKGHTSFITDITFSPKNNLLASASKDRTVRVWDTANGQMIADLVHTSAVSSVAFSPDGRLLASSGSTTGSTTAIQLWDVASRQTLDATFTGAPSATGIAFSPDSKMLASGGSDAIWLWRVAPQEPLEVPLVGHKDFVTGVAFSPDGKVLASVSRDHTARLWDVARGRLLAILVHQVQDPGNYLNTVAFSPDGKTLATGADDWTVRFWSMKTGLLVHQFAARGQVQSLAFSPNGEILAVGDNYNVWLWDLKKGNPYRRRLLKGTKFPTSNVVFSPNGAILALASAKSPFGSYIQLWNTSTGNLIRKTANNSNVHSLVFSPDGKTLVSGSADGTILFTDVSSLRGVNPPLANPGGGVTSLAFSADGRMLAAGGGQASPIALWSMPSRQYLGALTGHTDVVTSVAFSPNGKVLASGSDDRTVGMWQLSLPQWQTQACRIANRDLTAQEWRSYLGTDIGQKPVCPSNSK